MTSLSTGVRDELSWAGRKADPNRGSQTIPTERRPK